MPSGIEGISMIDLAVENDDIVIENFDLKIISGKDQAIQQTERRLRLWLGEWFLNTSSGIPWLTEILGKKPDETIILAIIRQSILDNEFIAEILNLEINLETSTRRLDVAFSVRFVSGEIIENITVTI